MNMRSKPKMQIPSLKRPNRIIGIGKMIELLQNIKAIQGEIDQIVAIKAERVQTVNT